MNKKTKTVLIVLVILGLIVGGLFAARKIISSNKVVGVGKVENYVNDWYSDQNGGYGMIYEGGTQNIYLNQSLLIDKVYVEQGQKVSKGDELIKYDNTQNILAIESARINYEMTKNNLAKAEKTLAYYHTFTPYVKPEIIQIEIDEEIKESSMPVSGNGVYDDPYVFNVSIESIIKSEFLKTLVVGETYLYTKYDVYYTEPTFSSMKIASLFIDSSKVKEYLTNPEDFKFDEFITIDAKSGLIIFKGGLDIENTPLGTIIKLEDDIFPEQEEIPYEKSLTEKQINKLIKEQEKTIESLKISVSQSELDYKKAKSSSDDGIVRAEQDGIVSYVGDINFMQDGQPYIVIMSSLGYKIKTTINEYMLANIKVGDTFNIMMWSNGMSYTATISSISSYPTDENMSYNYSQNASQYEVIADLDCDDELDTWSGGEITYPQGDSERLFLISSCFVREENGRSYVLVANENNRIEKRYIETGKTINNGYYIEVMAGLDREDYIAFPYGNDAVEGAKADKNKEVYAW